MEIKVATLDDLVRIGDFERKKWQSSGLSEMELTIKSWNEPWREESLRHYLATGWCFVAQDGETLTGFILGQPLLFFQVWTQSLWIEYVSGVNDDVVKELLQVSWRWARSKHLQKVFFNKSFINKEWLADLGPLDESSHFQAAATKTN